MPVGVGAISSLLKGKREREKRLTQEELIRIVHRVNVVVPDVEHKPLTEKEVQEAIKTKAAHETINKLLQGKELLRRKPKKLDARSLVSNSHNQHNSSENTGNPYLLLYIGLALVVIGVVITFAAVGGKGFKTIELTLIGPVFCILGIFCIILQIAQCTCPRIFRLPGFVQDRFDLNCGRLTDLEGLNVSEEEQNKQNVPLKSQPDSMRTTSDKPSPRVLLGSVKKAAPPAFKIPNYIGDGSDEDEFSKPGVSNGVKESNINITKLLMSTLKVEERNTEESSLQSCLDKREPNAEFGDTPIRSEQNGDAESRKETGKDEKTVLTAKAICNNLH